MVTRACFKHKALMLFSLLVLSGCAKPVEPIRFALNPWPGYVFLHLAEELGYFEEEGVSVELVDFLSLGDSSRAYERGQVDGWGTTIVELLLSHTHSERFSQAVWVTNVSHGGDMILARNGIKHVADLKGRRVAVEPATVDVTLIYEALRQAGLGLSDVKLVPLAQGEMVDSMQHAEVDAVIVYPPLSFKLQQYPGINKIFDSSQAADSIVDVLAFDKKFLLERKKDIAAFVRAFSRAQHYWREHPRPAHEMMAKYVGVDAQTVDGLMRGIRLVFVEEQEKFFATGGVLENAIKNNRESLDAIGIPVSLTPEHRYYSDYFLKGVK